MICFNLAQDARDSRVRDEALRTNPLRGIWSVEEFAVNSQPRLPITTDPVRWQRVVIDSPPSAILEKGVVDLFTVQSMTGSLHSLTMQLDSENKKMLLRRGNSSNETAMFIFSQPNSESLVLDGTLDGQQIHARLQLSHMAFTLRDEPLDPWNP